MKNRIAAITVLTVFAFFPFLPAEAQDTGKSSPFRIDMDLASGFIWRGSRFGTGPHMQPALVFESGGLEAGVWGSFDTGGYSEVDPFVFYNFPSGIVIGATDYYSPDLDLFGFSSSSGSHALELSAGFSGESLTLEANCILNAAGGIGSTGGDIYLGAEYTFSAFSLFAGAGNGWHTVKGNFNICNLGIGTTKTINITDGFVVPVTGQIVINPDTRQLFLVALFSFSVK